MQAKSICTELDTLDSNLESVKSLKPGLVLVFTSSRLLKDGTLPKKIQSMLPDALIMGCSTAGEIIQDGATDDKISIVAVHFEKTLLKAAITDIENSDMSFKAGEAIADQLNGAEDLSGVFTLSPGLNVNGSEYIKGLSSKLNPGVPLTGGLAGDGVDFQETYTLLNDSVYEKKVVAIGFYGDSIHFEGGSGGGWNVFGPSRRVTKSSGNILYELDNSPALQLYKDYLGDKADELPSSGLLYPFAILNENDHEATGLIRTILDVDHDMESLTLAGDLPEGSLVCLMHADNDSLIEGAEKAAQEANIEGDNKIAFLVSCVGRKIIMGDDSDEEVEAVLDIIGNNTPISGFYSYGEIGPFSEDKHTELHNQTMTITCISET